MKKLLGVLILALSSMSYAESTFGVNKVLPVSSFTVTKEKPYFVIWREVCADKDLKVEVYRRWTSLSDEGKVYRDGVKSDYGYKGSNKCKSDDYIVRVPPHIPDGEYIFNPIASFNNGSTLVELPTEKIVIRRE